MIILTNLSILGYTTSMDIEFTLNFFMRKLLNSKGFEIKVTNDGLGWELS